jgi:hypothetical protein
MAEEQQGQQGNVRQEYNLGRIGLNMDSTVNQVEKGKLTYALNANLENFDANSVNYQNEQGNKFCLKFPENYHLIGEHFIQEQNKHVFFLTNPATGGSEIGYMDNNDCVYHTYISGSCLNFSIEHPIHKAVHKITNCSTEIYWTDGYNPRRYINLQDPPYTTVYVDSSVCNPETILTIDCNKIKVQPNFSIPQLSINSIINGGDLKAGIYQFAIQYCSALGDAYTSYYSVTNPTPIANPQLTTANFDYAVGRSIVIDISDIDLTGYFEYYNVAVIKTINGASTVELVGTYFIDGKTNQITYTGQGKTGISLSTADIFEKYPYYDVAEDLTTVQDVLVWDNLTSIDRMNYQKIANQIDLLWETYKIPSNESYADALNATNLRGYLRDEVYAFEIVFLLKNGKQTDGFHIPGRSSIPDDLVRVYKDGPNANNDFVGTPTHIDGDGYKYSEYWRIYNTASAIGNVQGPKIGNATPYQYGNFAYWESSEKYPCNTNVWGELADQPIRHHKFPDVLVSPIFESGTYTLNSFFQPVMQSNAVYPIGVKISTEQVVALIANSDLTNEQKSEIAAYKIVRGDRSTNQSIVAKGILRNVGTYRREGTDYYYPNYPYNDINEDPFLLTQNNAYNSQCITYKVTAGGDPGTLQYSDCSTNELSVRTFTANQVFNQCSTTVPQTIEGTATIVDITGKSYFLVCNSRFFGFTDGYTTFSYTDPGTLASAVITVYYSKPKTVNSTTLPVKVGGSPNYQITINANNKNAVCYPSNLSGFSDSSKSRYVFNSPETSFGQPNLGNVLKIENALFGGGKAHFVQVKKNATYKLISQEAQVDALNSSYTIAKVTGTLDATAMFTAYQAYLQIYINGITRRNYAYSYNSVASYDYSADVNNNTVNTYNGILGVKQRELDIYQYLIPGVQSVGDNHNINNFQRESSVYLKTPETNPIPFVCDTPSLLFGFYRTITDQSRFTVSQRGNCATPEDQKDITVVSYYGSIKNTIINQWGQMYSYNTIDTGYQVNFDNLSESKPDVIFGGDTFIGKFAYKTKLPFFIDNRVGAPDDSDIYYDEIGNVAYPQYWHSSRSILSNYMAGTTLMKNIISVKAHYFDCPNDTSIKPGTTTTTTTIPGGGGVTVSTTNAYYDGKFYLFAYGIPYFYCESSINVDLRQAFNNQEGDFYPHVSTGIPDNWLQQSFVPIAFDNTYTYNLTYSKQNKENYFSHLPVDWSPNLCYTNYPFRTIYSEQQSSNPSNKVNSWLNYLPISYFDFPQNFGKLISLDGIQNRAILARFENKSLLYNTLLTMNTSNPQAAYLGNPTLFRSAPPVDFAETDLGFVGSQNKMLLKIPQGQITVDAKRGQIFLISGNQAMDMSAFGSGVNRFITDHLPFEILKYYPTADTDNHFNGIGIHGVYDSKYDRVIISKLDYIPQLEYRGVIRYDEALKKYYINKTYGTTVLRQYVDLTDIQYFCNKSWTLSFDMNTKSWVSFHSYIPNFYIAENNFFYSGLNEGCDLAAVALQEVAPPTTTSTTTAAPLNCNLAGTAVYVGPSPTTTTTSSTTTLSPQQGVTYGTTEVAVCYGGGSSITTLNYVGGTNICNAVSVNSSTFNTLLAQNYYLYNSSLGTVLYNKSGGVGTTTMDRIGTGCVACPTTTTTTTNPACPPMYTQQVGQIWICDPPGTVGQYPVMRNTNSCYTGPQYYCHGNYYTTQPPDNSEPSTEPHYVTDYSVNNGIPYCGGMNNTSLITPLIDDNPCSPSFGIPYAQETENSPECACQYTMHNCSDDNGSTAYSTIYGIGTFEINQRVVDADGIFYYITGQSLPDTGGKAVTIVEGETMCPYVYTIVQGCSDEQYYSIGGTHYYTNRLTIDALQNVTGGTQCALVTGTELTPSYPTAGVISTDFCAC